jgi:hypothetical protein
MERQVFRAVDSNDRSGYFLMPNGGFETGANEWQLRGGAAVVTGNNTVLPGGTRSLRIPNGAVAQSRTICVGRGEEAVRLVVENPGVPGAILHVQVIVQTIPAGGAVSLAAFDVNGDPSRTGWRPTPRMTFGAMLNGNGQQALAIRFSTRGTPATWRIDDVYVDPFKPY